jgi:hypothetical protein
LNDQFEKWLSFIIFGYQVIIDGTNVLVLTARLSIMSQKTDPSPIRIVRVGGQPVRLAAVLQSGQTASRQISTANYLKVVRCLLV